MDEYFNVNSILHILRGQYMLSCLIIRSTSFSKNKSLRPLHVEDPDEKYDL